MEWVEREQPGEGWRVLVVENDPALVQALARALKLPSCALLVSDDDSVGDILGALQEKSSKASVLYLDAQLVFRECPDPSYYGGLELVKHIRITPSLEPLSLLPIVIGTVDAPAWLIRQGADNVIVFSPGCEVVKWPAPLERLRTALRRHRPFTDEPTMRRALRPFVIFTDADERARHHAYLNRAGVGKFLREFAGSVIGHDHPRLREYDRMLQTEIWLKKMHFLRSDLQARAPVNEQECEELRRACHPHRFILVDDDYNLGWSLGLRAGLFGDPSDADDRLLCIAGYDEAVAFFEEAAQGRERALEAWAQAEYEYEQKIRCEAEARQRRTWAQQARDRAQANLQAAEQNLQNTQKRYRKAEEALQRQFEAFISTVAYPMVEQFTKPQGTGSNLLDAIPHLPDNVGRFNQALNDCDSARQSYERAESACQAARRDYQEAEVKLREAEEAFRRAQRDRTEAETKLRQIEQWVNESFPYRLVFLDLRLQLPADEHRPVEELTGIRLLGEIKRRFPDLPVIVMTASEKALTAEKARELGADGYWVKGLSDGRHLRQAVLECLKKAELRSVWLDIQKVKRKAEIHCFLWQGGQFVPRPLGLENPDRLDIVEWLTESFWLLWHEPRGPVAPYERVVLNMGRIQEVRYRIPPDVRRELDDLNVPLPPGERKLRQRRNEVAHARKQPSMGRTPCTREEALEFLWYTLEQLLRAGAP